MPAPEVGHRDVLMFINSWKIVRTLPPDAQNEAIGALRDHGCFTYLASAMSGHTGAGTAFESGRFGAKPILRAELSDDERATIGLVYRLVHERGMTLHIVDVGRESALRKYITEHLHHLHDFPVLVRPDGRRLEGLDAFTSESLASFLAD
jgi:hypothetical protein